MRSRRQLQHLVLLKETATCSFFIIGKPKELSRNQQKGSCFFEVLYLSPNAPRCVQCLTDSMLIFDVWMSQHQAGTNQVRSHSAAKCLKEFRCLHVSHYSLGAFTALPLDVFVNFICQIIDVRHKGVLHFHSIGMLGYHWFKKKKK